MDFYKDKAMALSRACKDYLDRDSSIAICSFSLCKELYNGLPYPLKFHTTSDVPHTQRTAPPCDPRSQLALG